jgi:hypothetical protein
VYGLNYGALVAVHVAIVISDTLGNRGPDVINGDGDRTGFSVVEIGTDESRADVANASSATISGYVAPS